MHLPPPAPPLLAALDERRSLFLEALAGIPEPQCSRKPSPTAWSPLEIGEHLVLVEEQMAHFTDRQLQAGPARKDVGAPNDAKVDAVLAALRTPAPMMIPERASGIEPTGEVTLEVLVARWNAAAERWHALVAAFPPELLPVALLRHPVAGPVRLDQTLRFLEAHIEHHTHQLARTVRSTADPS